MSNWDIMVYYLYILVTYWCVVGVLGRGCVTFTLPKHFPIKNCKGAELARKGIFVSYDAWTVKYYSASNISRFNESSKAYISPSQPYLGSCSSITLKMVHGSKLHLNVYMSKFPSSLLYIKVYNIGDEQKEVADWSNLKDGGWKPKTWSKIVVSLSNGNNEVKTGYYAVAIVGITRDTGTLMIESMQHVSPEFDGKCEPYLEKNRKLDIRQAKNIFMTTSGTHMKRVSNLPRDVRLAKTPDAYETNFPTESTMVNNHDFQSTIKRRNALPDSYNSLFDEDNEEQKVKPEDDHAGSIFFWCAVILTIIVTGLLVFTVAFCISQNFNTFVIGSVVQKPCTECMPPPTCVNSCHNR